MTSQLTGMATQDVGQMVELIQLYCILMKLPAARGARRQRLDGIAWSRVHRSGRYA